MLIKLKTNTNILMLMLFIAIALGYVFMLYRYHYGYLAHHQFITLSTFVIILFPVLILLSRGKNGKSSFPSINARIVMWILIPLVFLSVLLEVVFLGHTGLVTVIVLVCGLVTLSLSKPKVDTTLMFSLLIALLICVHYGIYTPSFGIDTWRDSTQALQIIKRGGIRDLTIERLEYPLPVVSVLYAMHSIITEVDTLWTSSIIGLLYLKLFSVMVYIISRRYNVEYSHISAVLLLSTPLVVIWSVWFIPQAYALLMAIPLLFLDLPLAIVPVFSVAMVLGHGGQSLWTLMILIFLTLVRRFLKTENEYFLKSVDIKLLIVALIFAIYMCYTLVLHALVGPITKVIDVIISFLAGEKVVSTFIFLQHPVFYVLGVIPIVVIVVIGFVLLIESENILMRLFALVFLIGLGLSYVGDIVYPELALPRYVGLSSIIVLGILSPLGIQRLAIRGRAGTYYALALVLLAVVSFTFSGSIIPENPYTANPYAPPGYSISGLLTYDEAQILKNIASLLCCENNLVDWRAGVYLRYIYLWVQPERMGFYDLKTQSAYTFAGSYGLYITPEYLTTKCCTMFIYRKRALEMPGVFSPDIELYLNNITLRDRISILYSSPLIKTYFISYLFTD